MNCPQNIDWKAYAVGEFTESEQRAAVVHLPTCADCREELVSVQSTLNSLAALRDEEMPRRIAFLSEARPEPGWWQRWNPMLASASLVAAAIIVHALVMQPSTAIPPAMQAEIQQQADENKQMQDRLLMLDQQTNYFQQQYKAQMNLVTY